MTVYHALWGKPKSLPLPHTCPWVPGFQGWGKCVFWTLELMATPINLASHVKVGNALHQSHSVQSHGPERAHQNNERSWRSSRTNRRPSRQFWVDWVAVFAFYVGQTPFWMGSLTFIFTLSLELRTRSQCQRSHVQGFSLFNFLTSKIPPHTHYCINSTFLEL